MLARAVFALSSIAACGCGSSDLAIAGAPAASHYLQSFEGEPSGVELGEVRLRPDVCKGLELAPAGRPLDADDFVAFAKSQGLETRMVRARHDLVFVDVLNAGTKVPVRFRVAILDTSGAAGNELHTALLQQGRGTWGLQRSNLAVLAPMTSPEDAVVMASKLRLACWGVFMIAGHDDTFVIPGGYTEL
ncbi:MAG: hypothetical protein KF894_02220 [Labilithrix sp.]|nr:hypothetical protein [Labilithrix sp.]